MNELIFLIQSISISLFALGSLWLGAPALVSFIAFSCVLANVFILKQITLWGLTATASDAFTIGSVLGLNLLQEYYGRAITKKAIWISFFFLLFYLIVSQLHLLYLPSMHDTVHTAYAAIFSFMPRIVIASLIVYLIVQHIDAWLYALLKRVLHDRYLVLRNYLSMSLSQLIDTVLFSFLGLYGIIENVGEIIIVSYCIKMATIAVATPFVSLSKRLYKE